MYKAVIAYDGTRYFGWQKTKTGPSIQEELEKAVRQITGETVLFEAASRTDRGVHARGQVVQFALQGEKPPSKLLTELNKGEKPPSKLLTELNKGEKPPSKLLTELNKGEKPPSKLLTELNKGEKPPSKLLTGLNAVLPSDIRVTLLEPKAFHPTLDAVGKEYHYRICTTSAQDPILRLYSWHFPYSLNAEAIQKAISHLLGTHDFSALANEEKADPICTLSAIDFDGTVFRIQGNRFLYKMARNLVGLLIYVGVGKIGEDKVPQILQSKDRKLAGVTAPAHGLYLHQVFYDIK